MKTKQPVAKQGMALLMAMIVLLVMSIIGSTLFKHSEYRLLTVARRLDKTKSFWGAEGARQYITALARANPKGLGELLGGFDGVDTVESSGEGNGFPLLGFNGFEYPDKSKTSYYYKKVENTDSQFYFYSKSVTQGGSETTIGTYAWPESLPRWGWGMNLGATWKMTDTSNDKNAYNSVIGWGGANRIMGPFFAGDCLAISTRNIPNLCFGGEVTAYNFYESTREWRENPDRMISDSDNNGGKNGLSSETLDKLLANGYKRTWGKETYSTSLEDNYNELRRSATTLIGGAIDEDATPDDLVYEIEFLEGGGLKYRKTKAVLVADIAQGMHDRNSGNPLKLDIDGDGISDGSKRGHYTSMDQIETDLTNNVRKDLNVFLDFDFEPQEAGWTTIDSFDDDGEIISVNGDAYIYGAVDGRVTLVTEKNIFIGDQGLVYASSKKLGSSNWQDWEMGGKKFGDLANSADGIEQEQLEEFINENIDDMVGLVTRHQVTVLNDKVDSKDVSVHATVTISEDVDTGFAQGYDMKLDDGGGLGYSVKLSQDSRELLEKPKTDPVKYYGKKEKKAWGHVQDTPGPGLIEIPSKNTKYVRHGKGAIKFASEEEYQKNPGKYAGYEPNGSSPFKAVIENPIEYITANDWPTSKKSLPDYFYKQYCAVGFHPWGMRKSISSTRNDEMGNLNLFGGMSEYRHSRFNPNNNGMRRKFLYDWRFLNGQTPPGYVGTGYAFAGWTIVSQK